jgi:hypothetical protein
MAGHRQSLRRRLAFSAPLSAMFRGAPVRVTSIRLVVDVHHGCPLC